MTPQYRSQSCDATTREYAVLDLAEVTNLRLISGLDDSWLEDTQPELIERPLLGREERALTFELRHLSAVAKFAVV